MTVGTEELWVPHPWRCSRSGWMGFEQPGLMEAVPPHGRGLEQDDSSVPFHPKPFYILMIMKFCVYFQGTQHKKNI